MNGKSMVMLVLAVLSGLGAMVGVNRVLAKKNNGPAVEFQDVLVATRDLKAEETLKPDMVEVVKKPKSEVPIGSFTAFKDVEERWVQIKTLKGEMVLDPKLAPKGSPAGLVSRIPSGMRAFAVEVNEQSGVSGFVLPDHRVDVIQSVADGNGKPEAETILQDMLVLASGQTFSKPDDRSIQSRTVTLAVTPEQVDILVAARSKGTLTLALRGVNDREMIEYKKPKPVVREPEPLAVRAVEPAPVPVPVPVPAPPPPPPPAEILPAPAPVAAPLRTVTIYHGMKSVERVPLNGPELEGEDPAARQEPFKQ